MSQAGTARLVSTKTQVLHPEAAGLRRLQAVAQPSQAIGFARCLRKILGGGDRRAPGGKAHLDRTDSRRTPCRSQPGNTPSAALALQLQPTDPTTRGPPVPCARSVEAVRALPGVRPRRPHPAPCRVPRYLRLLGCLGRLPSRALGAKPVQNTLTAQKRTPAGHPNAPVSSSVNATQES